jgi:predicted dinucleotide-binding enzyme
MKIGVLGTGVVGNGIATKLVQLGYHVRMGARTPSNAKAMEWAKRNGPNASCGTFSDASSFGEIVFNCTEGVHSLEALKMAGEQNLNGKIIVDIANPLDFSKGMPATLTVCNTDSLGEQIQRAFPKTDVVKTLNTMNASIQTSPSVLPGEHDVFVSGNNKEAKKRVIEILKLFGWKSVMDLGDITTARGTEMLLPIWLRLYGNFRSPDFNFKIVRRS